MAPRSPLHVDAAEAQFDHALAILEAELRVVFAGADRVDAACTTLRGLGLSAASPESVQRLLRLIPLATARVSPATASCVRLLRDLAATAPRPWALLQGLLAANDPAVPPAVLDDAVALASRGALVVDESVLVSLASAVERDGSPLADPAAVQKIACLLQYGPGTDVDGPPTLVARLTRSRDPASRRLIARVLDLPGMPPDGSIVEQVIGPAAARVLGPHIAYSRATHLDLVDLMAGRDVPPLVASLPAAERQLGTALARDVVASLGWSRVSLGLDVRSFVGVSVDDSLPLILTPAEAHLFDECPAARPVFERFVVVGHGGRAEEPAVPEAARGSSSEPAGGRETDVIARFRAYNLLHAEVLAQILDIAPVTVERVHAILAIMDRIAEHYVVLFGSRSTECEELPQRYEDLKARILRELTRVPEGQPLPAEATRLVQMFEDPPSLGGVRTLHGLKRYLHQRGLKLGFGLLEGGHGTNRTVDVAIAAPDRVLHVARRIEYIDFEPAESDPNPAGLPYAVAVVVDGFARQLLLAEPQALPAVKVFCYGNEVHYYVTFRNHPVFIRIDYSPPLAGGMIDLQYYGVSKYELDDHPNPSLDAVQAFFHRLEFDVQVQNTRIHARYDKERALSLADICEKAEALFRLAPYLMDLDWTIGQLALPAGARREVGEAWADSFARWGTLPVRQLLTADRQGILQAREPQLETMREVPWDGHSPYRDQFSARPGVAVLSALRAAVVARHLPDVRLPERLEDAAQIPLERHLLRPLRAAVARGEVVATASGLAPAPAELFERRGAPSFFAQLLAGEDEPLSQAARLARLVAAQERSLHLETVGSVDGYDVQGGSIDLRGEALAIYALRDASGIIRLACFAPGGALTARRRAPHEPWRESATTDVSALVKQLRRNNVLPAWVDAPEQGASATPASVRALFAAPRPRAIARPMPGDRMIAGMSASPGRAVGLARLGIAGRTAAEIEGDVLIAPTVGPDDNAFLFKAAGVVCTGGGILSHAGLLAVQFGRPALIIPGTWIHSPETVLAFRRVEFTEIESHVAGRRVVARRAIRECEDAVHDGDLVELEADAGTVRVLGQQAAALALHEDLRHLDAANRMLAASTGHVDVLVQRGHRLRALHQLATLLGRLDDPALARHAARQLLASAIAAAGGGQGEQARLLSLLLDNPSVAAPVREHVGDLVGELHLRCEAAESAACSLIPSSASAVEVLGLRLAALRARDAMRAAALALASEAVRGQREPPPVRPDLDALARDRLDLLWQRMLGPETPARAGSPPAGPSARRHEARQLERLARVLRVSADDHARLARLRADLQIADGSVLRALAGRRILRASDGGLELQPFVGWKAANLAEVARLGTGDVVPSWFVITDAAFREVLASPAPPSAMAPGTTTVGQAIAEVLARPGVSDAQRSAAIRQLWSDVKVPAPLAADIAAAYRQLAPTEEAPHVAIRSSATEEDTEAAARAGEFDTFLFIRGEEAVLEHVKRAWSGLWTERALHNRAVLGLPAGGEGGGVLVQLIAWSRVSGVLQTVNTAGGRWREMVINVGLGMGEGIVSGAVGADYIVVSKEGDLSGSPLRFRYMTGDKRQRVVFDGRTGIGTMREDTVSHQRFRPALEYIELLELVQLAAQLEAAYGYPLDIEFGFEGPQLRLLQVRPTPGSLAPWRETEERFPLNREVRQ